MLYMFNSHCCLEALKREDHLLVALGISKTTKARRKKEKKRKKERKKWWAFLQFDTKIRHILCISCWISYRFNCKPRNIRQNIRKPYSFTCTCIKLDLSSAGK